MAWILCPTDFSSLWHACYKSKTHLHMQKWLCQVISFLFVLKCFGPSSFHWLKLTPSEEHILALGAPAEAFATCFSCHRCEGWLMLPPPAKLLRVHWEMLGIYFHRVGRSQTSPTLLYCTHVFWGWQWTTRPTSTCRLAPQDSKKIPSRSAWTLIWAPSQRRQVTATAAVCHHSCSAGVCTL